MSDMPDPGEMPNPMEPEIDPGPFEAPYPEIETNPSPSEAPMTPQAPDDGRPYDGQIEVSSGAI